MLHNQQFHGNDTQGRNYFGPSKSYGEINPILKLPISDFHVHTGSSRSLEISGVTFYWKVCVGFRVEIIVPFLSTFFSHNYLKQRICSLSDTTTPSTVVWQIYHSGRLGWRAYTKNEPVILKRVRTKKKRPFRTVNEISYYQSYF